MAKIKLSFEEIDEATEVNVYFRKRYIGWIQKNRGYGSWCFMPSDFCCPLTKEVLEQILKVMQNKSEEGRHGIPPKPKVLGISRN